MIDYSVETLNFPNSNGKYFGRVRIKITAGKKLKKALKEFKLKRKKQDSMYPIGADN